MTIWFTGDTHFGHKKVIEYCSRPFASVTEMDEALISNWNTKVRPGDTIYHVGDFAFAGTQRIAELLDRLNGQKVLIYGNHDKAIRGSKALQAKFIKCCDYYELIVPDASAARGKQGIMLMHYAMLVWNKRHHGTWMLHGHSHGSLVYPVSGKIMDVGVDANQFSPISYQEVKLLMDAVIVNVLDHHRDE